MPVAPDIDVAPRSFRAPAVTAAVAVAMGLCASRAWPGHFLGWWSAAIVSAVIWWGQSRSCRPRVGAVALLAGWMSLAAAWHDLGWSWTAVNDISRLATEDGLSVRLEAKVLEPAWIISTANDGAAPSWQPPERTLMTVRCRTLITAAQSQSMTGRLRLSLVGHYPELTCGDVIQVIGKLRVPAEPLNPGDFNYRTWLQSQSVRAVLQVESAECIQRIRRESFPKDVWGRVRQALRLRARGLFLSSLSDETSGVAETLLLGGRRRLDDELRQAFVKSGMLHVLAISGVNVALLGVWLMGLSRLAGLSSRQCLMFSMGCLVAYAAVTDGDPPVIRATAMALLGTAVLWSGRPVPVAQVVAVTLLGMMIVSPTDLFDAGAQLSFLSVLTINRTLSAWQARQRRRAAAEPPLVLTGMWPRLASTGTRVWWECTLVSLGIWLATVPLVAWRFQMVSLVGLVLNVVLAPLIVVLMWAGYSFLIIGLIVPVAAAPFAWVFDVCLIWLIRCVTWSSSIRFSHVDVASPPVWWMIGFYGIAGLLLLWSHSESRQKILIRTLLAWFVVGLGITLIPHAAQGLSCRFLAVGHGLSVLIELPDGQTVLYDAGSLGNPQRAAQTIANELRRRGRSRIDVMIISHADADHCNALPRLLEDVPIGKVLIGPGFLDDDFPLPGEIAQLCSQKQIALEQLTAGHQLTLNPDVQIRILHPSEEFHSDKDNPMSIIAAVEYRGRRVLLTGDLEGDGLSELLSQPEWDCDVLLSPHHGSKAANPGQLAKWATPEWVVVSTQEKAAEDRLAAAYAGEVHVLATARRGAIEFHIDPRGQITVDTFRQHGTTAATQVGTK